MKHCRGCDAELVVGENWTAGQKRSYNYICKPCRSVYASNLTKEQRDRKLETQRIRREDPGYDAQYRKDNRDVINAQHSAWKKRNPGKVTADTQKRNARKLNQTPEMNAAEWAEIEAKYLYNQIMPGKWHVDHIDPIDNGGLHHPANLQILSEHDNCSKGHRI